MRRRVVLTHHATVMYIWKKGSIEGDAWKTPFIGPFLESVNPDFTKYYAKWASGPLSCVSVFHKYDYSVQVLVA
jgi:C-22 sterol desaturase